MAPRRNQPDGVESSSDWRPVPDPTVLTTEALLREVGALRDLLNARIDSMEQATELRLETAQNVPELIQEQLSHLRQLHERDVGMLSQKIEDLRALVDQKLDTVVGRFDTVKVQFTERDERTKQAAAAADQALKAALQAAKELVGVQTEAAAAAAVKSETSFTKQIDQIGTIISTLQKALDARITELKERIDRGEGSQAGGRETRSDSRAIANVVFGGIALLVAILTIAVTIYAVTKK